MTRPYLTEQHYATIDPRPEAAIACDPSLFTRAVTLQTWAMRRLAYLATREVGMPIL